MEYCTSRTTSINIERLSRAVGCLKEAKRSVSKDRQDFCIHPRLPFFFLTLYTDPRTSDKSFTRVPSSHNQHATVKRWLDDSTCDLKQRARFAWKICGVRGGDHHREHPVHKNTLTVTGILIRESGSNAWQFHGSAFAVMLLSDWLENRTTKEERSARYAVKALWESRVGVCIPTSHC